MVNEVLKAVEGLEGQEKIDAIRKINKENSSKITLKQKLLGSLVVASLGFLVLMVLL